MLMPICPQCTKTGGGIWVHATPTVMGRKMVDTTASVCVLWLCWCVARLKMRSIRSRHSSHRLRRSSLIVDTFIWLGGGARARARVCVGYVWKQH